jgi:hypothetical protein
MLDQDNKKTSIKRRFSYYVYCLKTLEYLFIIKLQELIIEVERISLI